MLSAEFPPFRPSRILNSAHLQTVGTLVLGSKGIAYKAVKHVVHLHDDDRLIVHDDKPESWITGDRIAILLHGLCGSHSSPCIARTSAKLNRRGIRTIRVDMRGFGDSTFISKSHLHGGNYRDAISVIEFVHRMSPLSKISLVGFSVGGNVILKTLGYWGERPHSSVDSAITISPPIDLVHCSWNLRQQGNRLYELYFVKRMKAQLTARRKHVKDLVDNQMSPFPNRLIHWDDQFTAPCWGYRGAKEYYEDASSAQDLGQIKVPTVILTSRDDPVVPVSIYDECHMSDCIEFVATQKGGHLGFYSQGGRDPDRFWLDWRICQWVLSQDESSLPETPRGPVRRRGSARSLNRLSSGQRR